MIKQPVIVHRLGSNETGDGSAERPYATIYKAARVLMHAGVKNGKVLLRGYSLFEAGD